MNITDVLPGLSQSAQETCEWAGVDHHTALEDIAKIRRGESVAALLADCVDGADDPACAVDWAEYVAAIVAAAEVSQ